MEENGKKAAWWQPALTIGAQVTGWIAGPIVLALFLGKWLDRRYDSEPWLFIASMTVAFIITSAGIARVSIGYIKKIEKEVEEKNKGSESKR